MEIISNNGAIYSIKTYVCDLEGRDRVRVTYRKSKRARNESVCFTGMEIDWDFLKRHAADRNDSLQIGE